jgi:hypothetical protein
LGCNFSHICCHLLAALPPSEGADLLESAFLQGNHLEVGRRRRRQRRPPAFDEPSLLATAELSALQKGVPAVAAAPSSLAVVGNLCHSIKRKAEVLEEAQQLALVSRLQAVLEEVEDAAPAFQPTALTLQARHTGQMNRQPIDTTHKALQERFKPGTTGKQRTVGRGGGDLIRVQKRGGKREPREKRRAEKEQDQAVVWLRYRCSCFIFRYCL